MERPELTLEILLVLAIAAGALVLFIWNRLRVDVVALIALTALVVFGLVTPQQATSGFSNEATVTVALMLVLAAGLTRTGAIDMMGRAIRRLAGKSEIRFLLIVLAFAIPASALINNTPVVIVMLPILLTYCRETGAAPSRLLMPLSFGSQLGGTMTLIGTSTNLLVAGLVLELGLDRIGLFDITPPAALLMAIGMVYLLTIGRWITPVRKSETELVKAYELREYLTGLVVEPGSSLSGKTLAGIDFGKRFGLEVMAIDREGRRINFPSGSTRIEEHDILIARGKVQDIARIEASGDLRIRSKTPELRVEDDAERSEGLGEILVPPRSPYIGRTTRDIGVRARYGVQVIALQRHGSPVHEPIGTIPLEASDILLVQGPAEAMQQLHEYGNFALLGALDLPARRLNRLKFSVPIMVGVVLLAGIGVTTIMVSALMGAVAMLVTGCIKPDEVYRDVDWMVIVLLGAIIPLGIAMQATGAAEFIALGLTSLMRPLGLFGTLLAFYLLTSLLTEVISNNAAAVVLTPIAVAIAAALDASPLPFVIAVMIAASNSFMTPIGYQTNTFIFGPGGYRFSDFVRVGGPLNLILAVGAAIIIPIFFPF